MLFCGNLFFWKNYCSHLTTSPKVAILKSAVGADTHTKKQYGKIK